MKILDANRKYENTYESKEIRFAISKKEQKHIMSMLRDQIYSDKMLAPIREYFCNAADANIEAGNESKSIDINIIGTANVTKICEKYNLKLIYFSSGYVYEGKKGNYSEKDPVKPFNNYGLSKLGGESSVLMYKNSLVLRITMTEKPFLYKKAFSNLKTNFMFHEDLVKILPKLIGKKGIINVGGPSQSVYSFAKKNNSKVKKIKAKKSLSLPLNQTMNLTKMKKITDC